MWVIGETFSRERGIITLAFVVNISIISYTQGTPTVCVFTSRTKNKKTHHQSSDKIEEGTVDKNPSYCSRDLYPCSTYPMPEAVSFFLMMAARASIGLRLTRAPCTLRVMHSAYSGVYS